MDMDTNLPPPSYQAAESLNNSNGPIGDVAPPSYTFPTTFSIGGRRTKAPLVKSAHLKGHLALLHAFFMLRSQINGLDEESKAEVPQLLPADKDRRWAWFVGFAVDRFLIWCKSLQEWDSYKRAKDVLPPLDVLMVWHAYMLNPGWYAEDRSRIPVLRYLPVMGEVFYSSLSSDLQDILASPPSQARVECWKSKTSRSFDAIEDALLESTRVVPCPKCRCSLLAPYLTEEGTGYLQQNFSIRCTEYGCNLLPPITKAVLGVRKLAEDLVRDNDTRMYLAGTIRTPQYSEDKSRGRTIKDTVMTAARFQKPTGNYVTKEQWIVSIMEKNAYSLEHMQATMKAKMKANGGRLIGRIFSAYTNDNPFSVDLVGAVIRQGSFVKKMHDLQWTEPTFFDSKEDEIALQHAIARYHAFLDLMAASPVSFFVPTLDIDLAWHTHQLIGDQYNNDCRTYVGRFVDHDDKIEESTLSSAFDLTCRAWKDRFGVQYTHCGCPLPGETIGQKLSRLVGSYNLTPSYLVPPKREDLFAATHPSDHNAVFAFHRRHASEASQKRRREKFQKRQQRDAELVRRGKLNREQADRGYGHDPAFLVPVPLYFYYPLPVGCAAYSGSVINTSNGGGVGGCATGAGACGAGGTACGSGGGCGSGGCSGGGGGDGGGGGGCGGGGCGGGCGGG